MMNNLFSFPPNQPKKMEYTRDNIPETFLCQSQQKRDEIDVAIVSEPSFEIGPVAGVVLADVDGAGGIGRGRIRIRVTTFGRSTLSRAHNLPIGTDRCRCWHFNSVAPEPNRRLILANY